jgi:hypothetical protein
MLPQVYCGTNEGAKPTICQWNIETNRCLPALENEIGSQYGKSNDGDILSTCALQGNCRNINDLFVAFIRILKFAFGIAGSLAFAAFIYGGLMMIISFGNADKIEQGKSALQQLWGVATLPVQVGQELVNMGVSAVTQPYISQIQTLQTQNTQLYQTMVNLLRQGNTTTAQQVANQMLPGVQKQLQLTKGVSDMLKQRMQAGQFKADPALMQRYFDFAAQNRMNLRQLYEHALKNNSENFANNLMAVAKAKGIVDQNTVIPQGFQVNAGLAPQVTAPMGAGAAGAIQ